ncbi:TRAP transporter substrate-binding protein DctP [Rhodocyclaceae bacterium SMB388]
MKNNIISKIAARVLLGMACTLALPAMAQPVWKGYSFVSAANHPSYQHLESLAKEFESLSGGAVETKVNVGGSLPIPGTSITQAVGEGTLTFAHDLFFTGSVQLGGLTMLPMLASTHAEYQKAAEIIEPYLAAELKKRGVTLLATYNFPQQTIWSVSKVTSIDDLKGKKIRVGNGQVAEFMRRVGAIPVTLSTGDVAPALERSVIEGVVTASAGGGRLWGDMLKSNLRLNLNYDLVLVTVNSRAFERLPADVQEKFQAAARKHADDLTQAIAVLEDETTEQLKANGLVVSTVSEASREALAAQMKDYWDEWAENTGPEAVQALAKFREEVGK